MNNLESLFFLKLFICDFFLVFHPTPSQPARQGRVGESWTTGKTMKHLEFLQFFLFLMV